MTLAEAARAVPPPPEVAGCAEIVLRAVRAGWVDAAELRRLADDVARGEDPGVEELLLEHRAGRLRVALRDDADECDPAALVAWMRAVLARLTPEPPPRP